MMTPTARPNSIRYERDEQGIVTLTLDDPSSRVNTMNDLYLSSMRNAVARLYDEAEVIRGVILCSDKRTFFAGGDLAKLLAATRADAPALFTFSEQIKADLRRLELFERPVVAALTGSALGGGLEIALACHHRIAWDDPLVEIGLPEVTLGLLPGGGGVTRTVRMLGLKRALNEVLLPGTRFTPRTALELGLVDQIEASRDAVIERARAWILNNQPPEGSPAEPERVRLNPVDQPAPGIDLPALIAESRQVLHGTRHHAVEAIVSAAVEGAQVNFDSASRIESRYLTKLAIDKPAKHLIQATFYDTQLVRSMARSDSRLEEVHIEGGGELATELRRMLASATGIHVVDHGDGHITADTPAIDQGVEHSIDTTTVVSIHVPPSTAELPQTSTGHAPDTSDPFLYLSDPAARRTPNLEESDFPKRGLVRIHFAPPTVEGSLVEIVAPCGRDDPAVAKAYALARVASRVAIVSYGEARTFVDRIRRRLALEVAALTADGIPYASIARAARSAGFPPHAVPPPPKKGRAALDGDSGARGAGRWRMPATEQGYESIAERLLVASALEVAQCLEDGTVGTVAEANVGSVMGGGFPAMAGGAIGFMFDDGTQTRPFVGFVRRVRALESGYGSRFAVTAGLRELSLADGLSMCDLDASWPRDRSEAKQ